MIHYQDDTITLHHGDCIDVLAELPDHSVDACVTDPPYGLEFMGKDWDSGYVLCRIPIDDPVGDFGSASWLTRPSPHITGGAA